MNLASLAISCIYGVQMFDGSQTLEQIRSWKVDPFLVWPKFLFLFVFADISCILSWKCRFGNGIQNDPSIDRTVLDTQKILLKSFDGFAQLYSFAKVGSTEGTLRPCG